MTRVEKQSLCSVFTRVLTQQLIGSTQMYPARVMCAVMWAPSWMSGVRSRRFHRQCAYAFAAYSVQALLCQMPMGFLHEQAPRQRLVAEISNLTCHVRLTQRN